MEFNEIKKIWDSQNNRPLYAIDEEALHSRILAKKRRSMHITNTSEIVLITSNLVASGFVFVADLVKHNANYFAYTMATFMVLTAAFIFYRRIRRKKSENRFDRSVSGDLDHAIANATYQVRLSRAMRWYLAPMAALCLLTVWDADTPTWSILLLLAFFVIVFYASSWEHRVYIARKRSLEGLREKLIREEIVEGPSI